MKKSLLATAVAGSLLAGSALAFDPQFFIGAGIQYHNPSLSEGVKTLFKKPKLGLGLQVGAKFHPNFGARVGYDYVRKAKKTVDGSENTLRMDNIYADVLGYYGVSPEVELKGIIGIGRIKPKVKVDDTDVVANKVTGFRLGAGMEYKFDANLAAGLEVIYQKGKKSKGIKNDIYGAANIYWYI